jgi:hypothetical protein
MLKRWPELKLVKPRKLSMSRAKADLAEVMVCGLDSLLQTTLGGECSVAIPVSSTLKILLGLFLKLCFVTKDDNSLKYFFRV